MLSSIYRKQRKIEKDSSGAGRVEVSLSYFEIYNDKVFDLFESPELRTLAGLPIRDNNGKTVVAGLSERPCSTLRDFEQLYDEANVNRSTSATKLNAHSSRSHAILQVKVKQISEERTTVSQVSAIDLAGSEDNRRTDNNKERLVESSAINKSLFVLAQCVDAISKKQPRIPYRESKMTRILALGQNNGLCIMILNLAPVRSYHLDTLSSLQVASRTKKIEIREIENEPLYSGKLPHKTSSSTDAPGSAMNRQPLRPIPSATNAAPRSIPSETRKPLKTFAVFAEKQENKRPSDAARGLKRTFTDAGGANSRPSKLVRPNAIHSAIKTREAELTRANIEDLVNRMVDEKLAKQALSDNDKRSAPVLSDEIQRRLEDLEHRVEQKEDGGRAEGLQYLLMAKQHTVRGEDASALQMYRLALPFFSDNDKLARKMLALEEKISQKRRQISPKPLEPTSFNAVTKPSLTAMPLKASSKQKPTYNEDDEYTDELQHVDDGEYSGDDLGHRPRGKARKPAKTKVKVLPDAYSSEPVSNDSGGPSPRTSSLLRIINTRDVSQIRLLRGVGLKRAEAIVNCLCEMDDEEDTPSITSLQQLGSLKGVGLKTVGNMREGLAG